MEVRQGRLTDTEFKTFQAKVLIRHVAQTRCRKCKRIVETEVVIDPDRGKSADTAA